MKRATFSKPFNGKENALKLIPESYKIDGNKFEVTDGNETYVVKWEGSLTEGAGSVLLEADKSLISEDMQRIKHLMGYSSKETLGNLKGSERIDENKSFGKNLRKSRLITEAKIVDEITEDRYAGKLKQIIADIETIRCGLDDVAPSVFVMDNLIHVSGEDGQYFADYYGELSGTGYATIDDALEAVADKYGSMWEWVNPGSIVLEPLSDSIHEAFGMGFSNEGNLDGHDAIKDKEIEVREDMVTNTVEATNSADAKDSAADGVEVIDENDDEDAAKAQATAKQITNQGGNVSGEDLSNIQAALAMDREAGRTNEGDEAGSGIADIKSKLMQMRGGIQNAELGAVERTVIIGMLDMIEFFGADGNQFKGQVKSKLMALQSAMEQAAAKQDAKGDDTAEIANDPNAGDGPIGMNESDVEECDVDDEKDRFDEIFEGMYETDELEECEDELSPDQSKEMDTDKDGDIDGKDLSNLRKKK